MIWDDSASNIRPKTEAELFADRKARRLWEIDTRSRELIAEGLHIGGGDVLSLSLAAQTNLNEMRTGAAAGYVTFPRGVSTIDGGEYVIASAADFQRLEVLYATRKTSILDGGRALRLAVIAATDQDELDAVVDRRS